MHINVSKNTLVSSCLPNFICVYLFKMKGPEFAGRRKREYIIRISVYHNKIKYTPSNFKNVSLIDRFISILYLPYLSFSYILTFELNTLYDMAYSCLNFLNKVVIRSKLNSLPLY